MNNYQCYVKVPLGASKMMTKVRVYAENINAAIGQLVANYAKENVIGIPLQIK